MASMHDTILLQMAPMLTIGQRSRKLLSNGGPNCIDLTPWTYTTSYTDRYAVLCICKWGSFTLDYRTIHISTFGRWRWNLDANQTTTTKAAMEVIYNFTPAESSGAPEPPL